jgi:hypothetical protein
VPRHLNDVNEFNSNDKDITSPTLHSNGLANGNGILSDSKKSWSQTITAADGSRNGIIKTTKKYKKSSISNSTNNNTTNIINNNGIASNGQQQQQQQQQQHHNVQQLNGNANSNSSNSLSTSNGNVCNGIRKERSLHYCSICSKGFKDKYSVNVHIRTHTGEKVIH